MKTMIIFRVLLALLADDNAPSSKVEAAKPHLMEVAKAIAAADMPADRLIALSYEESRFGYKYPNFSPELSSGACGIYQQIVRWSPVQTTCRKLRSPREATRVAVAKLKDLKKRWGLTDASMCHYFSGNECDDAAALEYAQNHSKSRMKARRELRNEGYYSSRKPRAVASSRQRGHAHPRGHVHAGGLSCSEWTHALHHESNPRRRRELGLPPNEL